MLYPEARIGLMVVRETTVQAASAFSSAYVLQVLEPHRWDPLTAIAWKRVTDFQFYEQPHPPEPELVRVFQTSVHSEQFCLQWSCPLPNSGEHRRVPPLRQPQRLWISAFSALTRSVEDSVDKIHSLGKKICTFKCFPLVLTAQIFSNAEDNEVESQKQYPLTANLFYKNIKMESMLYR